MKKQSINYSWPAVLSDFSQDSVQENFSRCKLKVFYQGETADHRYFSESFSKEAIKTLPYTPVVSQYDADKEDFIGHAKEQQIFGIVDPCFEPVFEEQEDGNTWCVTEVVLYTERPDSVGDIAKKIIGQPHSLELNPKTVKYVINYDDKKHFKNIEFTAGQFVGVSVLGKDQKPAFTGSEFFSCDANFEAKMKILKDYCECQRDQSQDGGENMNLQEFMKLTWGDISERVSEAIHSEYERDAYTYVVDMYDDSAIVRFYYYVEDKCRLMRVQYTCDENGNVVLGAANEVHIVYEDIVTEPSISMATEIDTIQAEEPQEDFSVVATADDETITTEEVLETPSVTVEEVEFTETTTVETNDTTEENIVEEVVSEQFEVESAEAQVSDVEITPENMEASVLEDEQNDNTTVEETSTSTSSTSFTESEREEFESLKREKKIALVDSYKTNLTEEEYADFVSKIDNFDAESLEFELLKAYKRAQENRVISEENIQPIRAFAFAPNNAVKNESPLDAFVRKNKR